MSMPFYASAEQIMRDRSEFARKGIARGRGVVVLTYTDGVLFVAENASVALNDNGTEYTYRLVLSRGSDATAQTVDLTLLHTPAETDIRYAGVLQITQSYLSTDAAIGCADQLPKSSL